MKYILKGYIHSYLSLCKVQISLHDSTTFLLVLYILHKPNSDRLKNSVPPKITDEVANANALHFSCVKMNPRELHPLCGYSCRCWAWSVHCYLTFALKVWNFFF